MSHHRRHPQDSIQVLLVDGHLNGDMREVGVDEGVGRGLDGRVVLAVLVVLRDGTDAIPPHISINPYQDKRERGRRRRSYSDAKPIWRCVAARSLNL